MRGIGGIDIQRNVGQLVNDFIMADNYPYYVIPDIEALSKVRDAQLLRLHRRRIAACIGDPDALRAILGDASEDFQDFYGTSELPNLSTADTIDSFLEKFGSKDRRCPRWRWRSP